MSLTASEEALVRQLLEQQTSILSLAGNESTITSKLGATKVTLSDLVAASAVADTDLLLTRQGTNDKSVTAKKLAEYIALQVGIPTAVAGGTADAITADFTPDVALTNGITVIVRAGAANATTTPTFAPDGLTAKTIVKGNNLALAAGDIAGAGHWLELAWDSTLSKWVLQNPAKGIAPQVGIPTAVAGGTANANTANFTPDVALTHGTTVIVRAGATNTITTPTFAPDGLTAKTIVKGNNLALAAGDIAGSGHWLEMNFDTTLDKWVLQNPATGILGGLSIASAAEAQAFTDNTKAISPLRLKEALQGANQSLAASGYQRLPGGLIIQWGKAVGVANGGTAGVTFPLAFPTLCAAAFADAIISSTGTTNTQAHSWNTTGMTVFNGASGISDVHWLAIGF